LDAARKMTRGSLVSGLIVGVARAASAKNDAGTMQSHAALPIVRPSRSGQLIALVA
jgi:hypothetical protein